MKRILPLILALLFILCGCSEDPKPTEPTKVQTEDSVPDRPTAAPTQPTEAPTPLSEHSDFELIEATVKSDVCSHRTVPSYEVRKFTDQEWVLYMMENCDAFRELMFRDTALESLEHYAPVLFARYCESHPHNASGLFDLVVYLIPEIEDFIIHVGRFRVNEAVQSSYASFLSAMMNEDSSAVMKHMHFEDDASAEAFQSEYCPLTEATVLIWDCVNYDERSIYLYAVTTFVRTEQKPEGYNVTHFVARFDHQYLVMPDLDQIPVSLKEDADLSEYIDLSRCSDYELMELTIKEFAVGSRYIFSYRYTNQEWVQYIMEQCKPFEELMSRDTSVDSLKKDAVALVEKYREKKPQNASGFAELVTILIPEMEGAADGFVLPANPVEMNWVVPEAYNTFLRAAMSGAVPLRYMHFEDEAAEAAFSESFSAYTDATVILWRLMRDTLFGVDVCICTEENPEGQEVTHFIGCIDDQWLVMLNVDQIPAELKEGLDLSKYE